jgi:hypothetical protein
MQRLAQNALCLRTEPAQFFETQIESKNENFTRIPEGIWKTAMTVMPLLNMFKYSIEILGTKRMATLAHVIEMERMTRMAVADPLLSIARCLDRRLLDDQIPNQLPDTPSLAPLRGCIGDGCIAAGRKRVEKMASETKGTILLSVILNPGVDPNVLS